VRLLSHGGAPEHHHIDMRPNPLLVEGVFYALKLMRWNWSPDLIRRTERAWREAK
jgi:hypothetical protein